ncbi:hypothetical protein HQ39_02670 [Porphyromonas sp. COT-108 OH2963]|nr:hypothetical protein HQ39_02670 [Porphyromonas sp. COT-108 OH2963]
MNTFSDFIKHVYRIQLTCLEILITCLIISALAIFSCFFLFDPIFVVRECLRSEVLFLTFIVRKMSPKSDQKEKSLKDDDFFYLLIC